MMAVWNLVFKSLGKKYGKTPSKWLPSKDDD